MNLGYRALLIGLAAGALLPRPADATTAIANWNTVPFETFTRPFKVGVVAFHETGVDVVFTIDGAEVARVADPAWNDRTGVFEYWIEIDPRGRADGPLALGATAIPDGAGHASRALSALTLYSNGHGTLTNPNVVWADAAAGNDTTGNGSEAAPYATIKKAVLAAGEAGTVFLKAGAGYKLTAIAGGGFTRWTTVSAAPGLSADDVHILTYGRDSTSTGRYNKSGIRWRNVSLYCDRNTGWGTIFYFNDGERAWFDGAVLYDKNGRWAETSLFNRGTCYLTDTLVRDVSNCGGTYQRNVRFERIGSDIYRGSNNLTAVNVTIRTMDKGSTTAHPDFIQFYNPSSPVRNVILYNVKCYDMNAQGIFGAEGEVSDTAFVNVLLEKDPSSSSFLSQVSGNWQHVLLWYITTVDQTFSFRDIAQLRYWDARNGVFSRFSAGTANALPPDSTADAIHVGGLSWDQPSALGTRATVGDPLFVDVAQDDYRLQAASPAAGTGRPVPGVPGDVDGYRRDATAPSRGVFEASNPGTPTAAQLSATDIEEVGFQARQGGGTDVTARVRAFPTARYAIRSSADLATWTELPPLFADPDGLLWIRETVAGDPARRFYRLTPME